MILHFIKKFKKDDEIWEDIENKMYFSPEKGNIIFSSAIDCWAFTI